MTVQKVDGVQWRSMRHKIMQKIQTTTRRSDRRMPGHCRKNVGYSHADQRWFFLVILTGLIFFVQGRRTTRHMFPMWAQGSFPKELLSTNQQQSTPGITSPAAVVPVPTIDRLGLSSVTYHADRECKKGWKLKLSTI